MIKIDEDDEFNRNDKKFVKIKMVSLIKIYKLTKSVILVKSVIYKVNQVNNIVIRDTSTFVFFKKIQNTQNSQKYTLKTKTITIF